MSAPLAAALLAAVAAETAAAAVLAGGLRTPRARALARAVALAIAAGTAALLLSGPPAGDTPGAALSSLGPIALAALIGALLLATRTARPAPRADLWLHGMLDALEEAVFVSAPDRTLLRVNAAARSMFAVPPGRLPGVAELCADPASRPELEDRLAAVLATGAPASFEGTALRADGTSFPAEFTLSVLRDERGRTLGALTVVRNVSERRRMEEGLREREELFRELADSITDVFFAFDADQRCTYWNRASERTFGISSRDAIGESLQTLFAAEEHRDLAQLWTSDHTRLREQFAFVARLAAPGGARMVEVNAYPSRTGISVFARDITERIEAGERLAASLREKEALLQEIHHRVKNNLQIISSLLNLQADTVTDDNALEALRESQSRVRSMALIHEQLYQSGNLARIDYARYVNDLAAHLFRTYSKQASIIRLTVDVPPVSLSIDKAIPSGMIINELLTNCLKHAFPDGRQGRVTVRVRPTAGQTVALSVSDDGVGFPPDTDAAESRSLGLKLVRMLASQLRGSVRLTREHGTEFTVEFPAGEAPRPPSP